MGSSKGRSWASSILTATRGVLAPLLGSGRGLFGISALLILLVVAVYVGWAKWGGIIARSTQYALTAECFEITPQPPWIHSDIKSEVMRDGSLHELSVLDRDLTKRVVRAFELHTWVAEALWAGKRPGDGAPRVIVKLRYREPVIMVRTDDRRYTGDCFWPVDTEGVFLPPNEFSPNQTESYLRVDAGNVRPAGAVGTSYGDAGVVGAAKIADVLKNVWKQAGLAWIVVRKELPLEVGRPVETTYVLLPDGATPRVDKRLAESPRTDPWSKGHGSLEVRWGRAPGREAIGEAVATEKLARLMRFVRENGPLGKLPKNTIIDLRPASAIAVMRRRSSIQPASLQ